MFLRILRCSFSPRFHNTLIHIRARPPPLHPTHPHPGLFTRSPSSPSALGERRARSFAASRRVMHSWKRIWITRTVRGTRIKGSKKPKRMMRSGTLSAAHATLSSPASTVPSRCTKLSNPPISPNGSQTRSGSSSLCIFPSSCF
ncbi:hypothetical protein BDP27DRAFT_993262 [Rhodocollybia butyracea]|uniref:Uncharacterized protein n=1 Tax=Rhodocollybia butyracea TaxID=206335 RepID=A0A9P5U582_9AGAR|nr:hypothetical protein BDP27DRAFT_993262 [Rhodocollybia butyracea]